jgi:hypothetical protein
MKMRKDELFNQEMEKYFGDKVDNTWIKIWSVVYVKRKLI